MIYYNMLLFINCNQQMSLRQLRQQLLPALITYTSETHKMMTVFQYLCRNNICFKYIYKYIYTLSIIIYNCVLTMIE